MRTLPLVDERVLPDTATGKASILAVDDDDCILRVVEDLLGTRYDKVFSTTSPLEAISILQKNRTSVIICDQMMPGMKGIDLLALVRKRWPRMVTILLTACNDMHVVEEALDQGLIDYFVTKPWNTNRFLRIVGEAVDKYEKRKDRDRQELPSATMLNGDGHARGAVFALSRAVDARDCYTRRHSENVATYSVAIAKVMGLEDDTCELLRIGGLLHDIGKIGIPDGILLKKGRLEAAEFDTIRTHPSIGLAIIEPIGFPKEVNAIVKQHHENHDGSGYPDGLKMGEISLLARIVHVADAYDAMSTNRVYRKACSDDYIMSEFEKLRGSQFDPDVTDAFIKGLRSGAIKQAEVAA